MRLEKRGIWTVGKFVTGWGEKYFLVLKAYSTRSEANDRLAEYKRVDKSNAKKYGMEKVETWFPSEF